MTAPLQMHKLIIIANKGLIMKSSQYTFSSLQDVSELKELQKLFNEVFPGEKVGDLALTVTKHMPGMDVSQWYTARDSQTGTLAAALTRAHWDIIFGDIPLKVWEQAIVGTRPAHRRKGLLRALNDQLHKDADENHVDMLIIQGIPDFYRRFGYRYALGMENHINLDLDKIEEQDEETLPLSDTFREATLKDYPLFLKEEQKRHGSYLVKAHRSEEHWHYYINEGQDSEYSSETWVYTGEKDIYYIKIQHHGFGEGLIVSEMSDDLCGIDLDRVLAFLKGKARENKKPYIRFNLPVGIPVTRNLREKGAEVIDEYGWQVKIPNAFSFVKKIRPVLQQRLKDAGDKSTGSLSLNMGKEVIVLTLKEGQIVQISQEVPEEVWTIILPRDLFEPVILGYRKVEEIRRIRPDFTPWGEEAGRLLKILFPEQLSWLYNIW